MRESSFSSSPGSGTGSSRLVLGLLLLFEERRKGDCWDEDERVV